jgi:hypothetical protein
LEQEIARLLTLELVKKSGERYRTDHKNEQKYDLSKAVLLDFVQHDFPDVGTRQCDH